MSPGSGDGWPERIFFANDMLANLDVITVGMLAAWVGSNAPYLMIRTIIGLVMFPGCSGVEGFTHIARPWFIACDQLIFDGMAAAICSQTNRRGTCGGLRCASQSENRAETL